MKIGLFIPCFMNELYPNICKATYNLLKSQNLQIEYPLSQTCCGQPMANSGCSKDVKTLAINFVNTFKDYDYENKGLNCETRFGDGINDTVTPLRSGSVGVETCEYYAPEDALKDYSREEILNMVRNPLSYSSPSCMGEFTKAIDAYSEGLKTDPNYPFAYWRKGLAYEKLGKIAEAQADYKKAYTLGMENNPDKFKEFLNENPDIAEKLTPKNQ